MQTTLIYGGRVRSLDERLGCLDPGYVLVEDRHVLAVGPDHQRPPSSSADVVVDATGCTVMPGLINMHQHHWYTLLKGQGLGLYLEDWFERVLQPAIGVLSDIDQVVALRLAAAEMLLCGTTTFFNHSVTDTSHSLIDALAFCTEQAGIRQVFGKEVRAVPEAGAAAEEQAVGDLLDRYPLGGSRFSAALVVETGAHWLTTGATDEAAIRRAHRLSQAHGVPVSDHITGGTLFRSVSDGWRSTGQGDVDRLAVLGALDERSLLVHALWMTPGETRLAAEAGATVVTCPASSAFTAGGSPPIRDFLQQGLNVCLGTDGPMVNDSVDLIEQLRACLRLANTRYLRPDAVGESELVAFVTTSAARALHWPELGALRPGARADIAVFARGGAHYGGGLDPDRIWLTAGSGRDARWVLVDGQIVVSPGGLETLDVREVCAEAREHAGQLWRRMGGGSV